MTKLDPYEMDILKDYEDGRLSPAGSKAEIAKLRAAARATAVKDRRVNIRLASGDLFDIQAKALEEGIPYQTLIASILHKYVSGRLKELPFKTKLGVIESSSPKASTKTPNKSVQRTLDPSGRPLPRSTGRVKRR